MELLLTIPGCNHSHAAVDVPHLEDIVGEKTMERVSQIESCDWISFTLNGRLVGLTVPEWMLWAYMYMNG